MSISKWETWSENLQNGKQRRSKYSQHIFKNKNNSSFHSLKTGFKQTYPSIQWSISIFLSIKRTYSCSRPHRVTIVVFLFSLKIWVLVPALEELFNYIKYIGSIVIFVLMHWKNPLLGMKNSGFNVEIPISI